MSESLVVDIELALPPDFHAVPAVGTAITPLAGVSVEASERLGVALGRVRAYAGERPAWVLIREPESGRVDAVLTLTARQIGANDSPRTYLDRISAESDVIVNPSSEQRLVHGFPAAVVHDFVVPAGESRPAQERGFVAIFLSPQLMYEFALITQDMLLFEDISVSLLQVLDNGLQVTRAE